MADRAGSQPQRIGGYSAILREAAAIAADGGQI